MDCSSLDSSSRQLNLPLDSCSNEPLTISLLLRFLSELLNLLFLVFFFLLVFFFPLVLLVLSSNEFASDYFIGRPIIFKISGISKCSSNRSANTFISNSASASLSGPFLPVLGSIKPSSSSNFNSK